MGAGAESEDIRAFLAGVTLIATHPRYQYFARAYGLDNSLFGSGTRARCPMRAAMDTPPCGSRDGQRRRGPLIWKAAPRREALTPAPPTWASAQAWSFPAGSRTAPPSCDLFLTTMREILDALAELARSAGDGLSGGGGAMRVHRAVRGATGDTVPAHPAALISARGATPTPSLEACARGRHLRPAVASSVADAAIRTLGGRPFMVGIRTLL